MLVPCLGEFFKCIHANSCTCTHAYTYEGVRLCVSILHCAVLYLQHENLIGHALTDMIDRSHVTLIFPFARRSLKLNSPVLIITRRTEPDQRNNLETHCDPPVYVVYVVMIRVWVYLYTWASVGAWRDKGRGSARAQWTTDAFGYHVEMAQMASRVTRNFCEQRKENSNHWLPTR